MAKTLLCRQMFMPFILGTVLVLLVGIGSFIFNPISLGMVGTFNFSIIHRSSSCRIS